MNPAAVSVRSLTKVYKHYWGPRSLLKELLFRVPAHNPLKALCNVSFDIQQGEAFGVFGDNGAGKSTLLKVMTGTTFPSSGSVEISGSVSALLELGAGFHPEFTGRENIYFNGALMGMGREEIAEREQEIIAFSELEEFIDRPVKIYSSGMFVRLGFAVATGFDPDILIIDEALAVGDQRFQKKCTDRILSFRASGKTIIFCSHNLYQVKRLCDRAVWLNRGKVEALGPAEAAIDQYTDFLREATDPSVKTALSESKQVCWVEEVQLCDEKGEPRNEFSPGETLELQVRAYFGPDFKGVPGIGVTLMRNDGVCIYMTSNTMEEVALQQVGRNLYQGRIVLPRICLLSGQYHFNVVTTDQHNIQAYDVKERLAPFVVRHSGPDFGVVKIEHCWRS